MINGNEYAEPPYDHLKRETAALLDASDDRKIAYINHDVFIGWPSANRALSRIQDCMDAEDGTRNRCLAILGASGIGKSHLWKEIYRLYGIDVATRLTANGQQPVLYVSFASATNLKAFLIRLLDAIGLPIPTKFDGEKVGVSIVRALRSSPFLIALLDEVQDLCKAKHSDLEDMALFLKYMSNEARRPLVMFGTPDAKLLINCHDQFRARVDLVALPEWSNIEETRAFIWELLAMMPLPEASPITDDSSIQKYLQVVKGNTERIALGIKSAARAAVREKLRKIDLKYLLQHSN